MTAPRNELNNWYIASVPAPWEYNGHQGWSPCIKWCIQTFGDNRSPDSTSRWCFISEGIFEFREESDLALFLLRWS